MVENIYSNDKNENEADKKNGTYKMPKNIRQIGQAEGNKKIYIEDYVMNYAKQLAIQDYGIFEYAVLIGNYVKIDGTRNIFINGAIAVNDIRSKETNDSEETYASKEVYETNNVIGFPNEAWTNIYENIKKYFTDVEIVGWFIGGAGLSLKIDDRILKVHMDNFAGQDKTLFMYDSLEQEEAFFIYENNHLKKQQGYYIYYERNEEMQNYMIDNKGGISEEVEYEDKVTKEIRRVLEDKKVITNNKYIVKILYGASTVLALIVLVIAATMLRNYDQINNMEEAINVLAENLAVSVNKSGNEDNNNSSTDSETADEVTPTSDNKEAKDNASEDEKTEVETMAGNVTTIKQENIIGDNAEGAQTKSSNNTEQADNTSTDTSQNDKTDTSQSKKTITAQTEQAKSTKTIAAKDSAKDTSKQTSSESTKAASKTTTASSNQTATAKYYTVKKGDTLASISLKYYNSTAYTYIKKILEANNIKDQDKIIEGEKIKLP